MISKEQAINESRFHLPQGKGKCANYRRNGRTALWVRNPERYRIPVKYGLYHYAYIVPTLESMYDDVKFRRGYGFLVVEKDGIHAEGDCDNA